MIIYDWNPLVNKEIAIEGDWGYKEGYISTLTFDSGKERTHLKNSFIPKVFPSLNLSLDNKIKIIDGPNDTEFKQFMVWYDTGLRYGTIPFYFNRLLNKNEIGIYKFIPESLHYTDIDGFVDITFGWEEIG